VHTSNMGLLHAIYPTVGSATHNKDCELTVMFVISIL